MDPRSACPKCGEPRRDERPACPRCGLLQKNWGRYVATPIKPSDALFAAWTALREKWSDEVAHKKFLDLAANLLELDAAAALYRQHLRELADAGSPDDPFARQGLERAAHLASVLGVQRGTKGQSAKIEKPLKAISIVMALLLLAIVIQLLRVTLRF